MTDRQLGTRWAPGRVRIARGLRGVLATLVFLLPAAALAGQIPLAWDPVPDDDVAGYRVYRGLSPDALDDMTDVGPVTSTTLTGVPSCTIWTIGVKAYDQAGLESTSFSNLVRGYPRPVIESVTPSVVAPGQTRTLTVTGLNFDPGDASDPLHPAAVATVNYAGVTVDATDVVSCTEMRVTVTASASAQPGDVTLFVENPDLSWSNPSSHPWVFASKPAAFSIEAEDDGEAPTVDSTSPQPGAQQVPANVLPQVTFSEAVDPASVTSSTVRLVDSAGAPVAAEAGSPVVEGAVVTIRPARPLAAETTYRIAVRGGAGGVTDLAGNPVPADYTQTPGFTIMEEARSDDADAPRVRASDPPAGAVGVPQDTSEIRITFDRDMSGLAQVLSADELRWHFAVFTGGRRVQQTAASPEFRHSGYEVVIHLDEELREAHPYTTMVHLAGDDIRERLEAASLGHLAMNGVWTTQPEWRVEGPLESVSYVDDSVAAQEAELTLQASLGVSNTGVPTGSVFRVRFSRPVEASSLRPHVFLVMIQEERRYRPVELREPIETEERDLVVVLDPVEDLPPGTAGRVKIATGPNGVALIGEDGVFTLPEGSPIAAPFATEVSATPASFTFGEAGAEAAEPGTLSVAWGEPVDELTAGFQVELLDGEGQTSQVLDAGAATGIDIPGLGDGEVHRLRLRPYDVWGHEASEAGRTVAVMPTPRVERIGGEPEPGQSTLVSLYGANFMDGARVVSRSEGVRFGDATVIRHDELVVRVIVDDPGHVLVPDDLLVVNPSPKSSVYFGVHPEAADVDGSGTVDDADAALVRSLFGVTPEDPRYRPAVDPNGDGVVDGIDLDLIEQRKGDERSDPRTHGR